jgi:purine-binding chemotaxis protein CheW
MNNSLVPFAKTPSLLTLQSANARANASEPVGFLCFTMDDEEFGVDLQLVCQVVKPPPVTWVPRIPNRFLGVIPIRGQVVTLLDLKPLMGRRPTEWPRGARVLIVDTGLEQIGLLVDSVTQVRRFLMKELEKKPSLPGDKSSDHVVCVARIDGRTPVLILDLDAVLQEKMK